MREVFFLAYHLHWSREEILNLSVPDRAAYVEMLVEQLKNEWRVARQGQSHG